MVRNNASVLSRTNIKKREPKINETKGQGKCVRVKSWRCWGDHYLSSCLEKKTKDSIVYNLKEESTVKNVARNILLIYVVLQNLEADYKSSMIEIDGKIKKLQISI